MSKNRICNFQGCYTQPIYNYKGIKKGIFCSVHKLDGMINVKDRKCEYIECNKIPNFNVKGEKKARFCLEHKTDF